MFSKLLKILMMIENLRILIEEPNVARFFVLFKEFHFC